ncbi:MAG TPA: hypothetical protein VHS96_06265, partial [Bacteroidia bacterium]|nr:hypothetical protein [Bacteroidia bacterium]
IKAIGLTKYMFSVKRSIKTCRIAKINRADGCCERGFQQQWGVLGYCAKKIRALNHPVGAALTLALA